MKTLKRIILVDIIILTVFIFSVAFASGLTITATIDNNKILTISGKTSSANTNVAIKVLDPQGNIDYLDQMLSSSDGKFEFKYSMVNKVEGQYTIYVSSKDVSTPVKSIITYSSTSSSGTTSSGSSTSANTSTSTSTQQQTQQTAQQAQQQSQQQSLVAQPTISINKEFTEIKVEPKVINNVALVSIDSKTFSDVISKATTNSAGNKIIEIEMAKKEGAKGYESKLPTEALIKASENTIVKVNTEAANVILPVSAIKNIKSENIAIDIVKPETKDVINLNILTGKKIETGVVVQIKADDKVVTSDNLSNSIIVTLPKKVEDKTNAKYLTVMKVDNNGELKPIVSSKYVESMESIAFKTKDSGQYIVVNNYKAFEDTKSVEWAKEAIEVLASREVIKGIDTKRFAPLNNVTRADFIVMLVRALDLNAQVKENFTDVEKENYYYEAVGIAKELGITNGIGNNKFNPKAQITRQDMIVLAERALSKVGDYKFNKTQVNLEQFNDATKVSDYAKESVSKFIAEGFLKGSNNSINPDLPTKRAEVATILYRIIDKYYSYDEIK